MDEGHRPDAGRGATTGAVFAQAAFYPAQQDTQHGALQGRIGLQEVAQALGHGEHPLPHRQTGKDVIGKMRCRLDHAPRVAGGAHATAFAGKGDQEVVFALVTVGSGKAVGKNAAFEIAAKCLLDMRGRRRITLPGR